jgi:hypothetical protein
MTAVMPKGVEHTTTEIKPETSKVVMTAVMPKDVEQLLPRL